MQKISKEQIVINTLVTTVKKFPELYNPKHTDHRVRMKVDVAWENVLAEIHKTVGDDTYTVEDLKLKWKGLRSSYARSKRSLANDAKGKVYYLYDSLKYLEPFVKMKSISYLTPETNSLENFESETSFEDEYIYVNENFEEESVDIKPEQTTDPIPEINITEDNYKHVEPIAQKRKITTDNDVDKSFIECLESNDDLAFFISILPDIKNFTNKQKRRLKMKILQSIDEIESNK